MKVAILNDTHAGVRNSSDIFIEYQRKFYEDVFFPYLLENDIKKIIHLGDYYEDRRHINFKALNANRQHFLAHLREYGMHMDIIPGNHDCYYKNTNNLNSLKELLGHYMNEVNIIMDPKVVEIDGLKFAFVPWITADNHDQIMGFLGQCDADVVGGHFELNGFDMYRGIACFEGMDRDILRRFDMVLSGHFHTKSQQGNIQYLGSQMEFFWNDEGDDKFFHVLDTQTKELTAVPNPITIYQKVEYHDEDEDNYDYSRFGEKFVKVVVKKKTNPIAFDRFLDRIQDAEPYELKVIENMDGFFGDHVSDESVDVADTNTLISTYVDAVNTDLDKNRIKMELNDLMEEAQVVELN